MGIKLLDGRTLSIQLSSDDSAVSAFLPSSHYSPVATVVISVKRASVKLDVKMTYFLE